MAFKVQLAYFRLTGKFLAFADCVVEHETLAQIWEEIHELRRIGRLPGLRVNAGRDLFILVDVMEHPQRVMHLVMPPFINEDDITPVHIATGEMLPLVRIPMEEMPSPRTTTRDVVKAETPAAIEADEEITPPDAALPLPDPPPPGKMPR
jgi:hypothetical protein